MKKRKIKRALRYSVYFYALALLILVFSTVFLFKKAGHKRTLADLEFKVKHQAQEFSGNFSLAVYKPGFFNLEFTYNGSKKIRAASVIKTQILAVALEAVSRGQLALDQKVLIAPSDLIGGSGILKRVELPIELTLEVLLFYMMAISDNIATNKVIDLLGFDYINQSFSRLGLDDTVLTRKMMDFDARGRGFENYTSSQDMLAVLKKIYYNRLFSKELSEFAKNLLLYQQHRDRIPLFLPKGTLIAHKTGLERGVVHDAGIIYGKNYDLIICVLTEDVTSYQEAKDFIAQISHLTYNLLN